jgi:hypothetical protein
MRFNTIASTIPAMMVPLMVSRGFSIQSTLRF